VSRGIGIIVPVFIKSKIVAIVFNQSIVGAKPHKSFTVLEYAGNRPLLESLPNPDTHKF
jgi:hypothetical protein